MKLTCPNDHEVEIAEPASEGWQSRYERRNGLVEFEGQQVTMNHDVEVSRSIHVKCPECGVTFEHEEAVE
jgi:hypothetical protein